MIESRSRWRAVAVGLLCLGALSAAGEPALASVCALADHIRSANANTAVGFCPAGTSHDIITITEDIMLKEPLPPITGTITIEGGGHTISGGRKFGILDVRGGNLTINNLRLTQGIRGNYETSEQDGGALRISHGAVVVVNRSVFANNRSHYGGGAINADRSRLTVNDSRFIENNAAHNGGAIYVARGVVEIRDSSFTDNRASNYYGGGIGVGPGATVDIVNSAFSGNRAARGGGAVATDVTRWTEIIPSKTTLTHVTILPQKMAGRGLGFSIWIDPNDAGFRLRNSIVAGVKGPYRKEGGSCHGPLQENIGNLIEDGSCGSMVGGDPLLAADIGSPGHFALMDGSPALDAADPRFCPQADQRGAPRPQGAGCDIGAFESTTAIAMPTAIPAVCPLPDQITAANTDSAVGNCPAGNGADTITMTRDYTLRAKLPPITSDITLEGSG